MGMEGLKDFILYSVFYYLLIHDLFAEIATSGRLARIVLLPNDWMTLSTSEKLKDLLRWIWKEWLPKDGLLS